MSKGKEPDWVATVMPDGYKVTVPGESVKLDPSGLFDMVFKGIGQNGEEVYVRGNFVTRIEKESA